MLSEQQAENIKTQLFQQLENLPEEKRKLLKDNIEAMSPQELEEFLIKNNLMKNQSCIFCSIVKKEMPSFIITEDEQSIAVLEINPVSKGHTLIVPKEHTQDITKKPFELTEKISNKIKGALKPKKILIEPVNLFGHEVINIIPVYKDETINSQKNKASQEELQEILKQLQNYQEKAKTERKSKTPKEKKPEKIKAEKIWLPKRIP
jgi:histidine triad (HIT) family protein